MDSKLYTLGEANEYLHNDVVNKPPHYLAGRTIEPITVIEDWKLDYHLGNALKYISRAGRKDSMKQDLEKAIWYIQRKIKTYVTD
jgi:hypothetical protein